MAGRAFYRILLISTVLLCFVSVCFAVSEQDLKGANQQLSSKKLLIEEVDADSILSDDSRNRNEIQVQEESGSQFRELYEFLTPDFSLGISYNNRSLSNSFLENNSILSEKGFDNQFLFSIDITPAVIILDQFSLEFTYSSIPDQKNFPNSSILNFESERRIVLNEVNRFSGRSLAISTAYSVPITEGIQLAAHFGIASLKLNVEETMQYHPVDPFARDFSIVTLPFRKREVSYSNPFAGISAEFQLRSIRLRTGYQIQFYELEEVSSTNLYISIGVRLRDLL